MSFIKDLAAHGKDKVLSKALGAIGGRLIGRYGRIMDLRLDSHARNLEMKVILKGEPDPIHILLLDYEVVSEGEKHFITFRDVAVSKEWMNLLALDLLKDKRFEIPAKYAELLRTVA